MSASENGYCWKNILAQPEHVHNTEWFREYVAKWQVDCCFYDATIHCGTIYDFDKESKVIVLNFEEARLVTRGILPEGPPIVLTLYSTDLDKDRSRCLGINNVLFLNQLHHVLSGILNNTAGLPVELVALLCEFRLHFAKNSNHNGCCFFGAVGET